jgi:hypothetical protein
MHLDAGTNRGSLANLPRHRKIWRLLEELQAMNPTTDAFEGSPAPLDGSWELLYSSAESFRRASPHVCMQFNCLHIT